MTGEVSVAEIADYLGLSVKTMYGRLKKLDGEFILERGIIRLA